MSNRTVTWGKADEQQLKELQERKAAFELARIQPVVLMVCIVHPKAEAHGAAINEIAERMIKHADLIRDALAPFDSGVRPVKEQQ